VGQPAAPEANEPEEFAVRLMSCPVAKLVIVTLAPLITALERSLTVPTMLPVSMVVWANNGQGILKNANHAASTKLKTGANFSVPVLMR